MKPQRRAETHKSGNRIARRPPIDLQDDSVTIKERHLGLHKPSDADVPNDHAELLGRLVEKHGDLDQLLEVAGQAQVPETLQPEITVPEGPKPRIAVAKDDAFCFYYAE